MTQAARAQYFSLATRALALSIGLGGISGLLLLPGQIATAGPGLMLGFVLGLWLMAYPVFRAEVTAARLHGQPLPLAISRGFAAGMMRPWWSSGLVLVFLVLILLVTLGGVIASWLLQTALLLAHQGAEMVAGPQVLAHLPSAFGTTVLCLALYWGLVAAGPGQGLMTLRPIRHSSRWVRLSPLLLLAGLALPGLILFPGQWQQLLGVAPQAPLGGAAIFQGAINGLFVSGAAFGVVYTAACRLEADGCAPAAGLLPILTVAGVTLWTVAAVGWSGALHSVVVPASLDSFLVGLLMVGWGPTVKIVFCLVLLAVLIVGARVMLDVPRHWLSHRLPSGDFFAGALLVALCFFLGVVVAFALAQGSDEPLQKWLLHCIEVLRGVLSPLAALLLTGLLVRSLPPPAMIWSQGASLLSSAAFYLYWRYAVRLFLVAVLLYESGIAAIVWNFWTQVPDG